VTIVNSAGHIVERLPFKMDTFLPHTAIDYPLLLTKALLPGHYRARVRLVVPGEGGVAGLSMVVERAFSVSSHDVKQVFTSAKPTQVTPGVLGDTGDSTPWALIAATAAGTVIGVVILSLLGFQLIRRRRGALQAQERREAG
jgi:hypothetical protein